MHEHSIGLFCEDLVAFTHQRTVKKPGAAETPREILRGVMLKLG
jgi:hypothetical protein